MALDRMSAAETLPLLRNLSPDRRGSLHVVNPDRSERIYELRVLLSPPRVKIHRPPHLATVLRQEVAKLRIHQRPSHPDGSPGGISAWTPQQLRQHETGPKDVPHVWMRDRPFFFVCPSPSWCGKGGPEGNPLRTEGANHRMVS